jgi:glutamate-1-semialdehyde 2,1-aminomutase
MQPSHEVSDATNHQRRLAEGALPLGVTDDYRFWNGERVIFADHANDQYVYDIDGVPYLDFRLAYGPVVLGYNNPAVNSAVREAIEKGVVSGLSTRLEYEVAQGIKREFSSVDKVRFSNSGTEAVMTSLRLARAYTKRQKHVICRGAFHGLLDEVLWRDEDRGQADKVSLGSGVAKASQQNCLHVDFNNYEEVETLFRNEGADIASVIIEPILGNCCALIPDREYLISLRDLCNRYGSLLIFDEIKTGFRIGSGGAQKLFTIQPDITLFGKAIANGFSLGAFGGREDVMRLCDARIGIVHGGTYTGSTVGLAAADATMAQLADGSVYARIEATGKLVRETIETTLRGIGVAVCTVGVGSMFSVCLSEQLPRNAADCDRLDLARYRRLSAALFRRGILT